MTSNELQEQLTDVEKRVRAAAQRAANASLSVDEKLEVQKDLDDLASLQKRLQAQLAGALQREDAIQKENEQAQLGAELDSLRSAYHDNRREANKRLNTLTETIVAAVPELDELNLEANELRGKFLNTYRERYGNEPSFQNQLKAEGLDSAEFSNRVAELLAGISNEIVSRRMAERRRNGV